MAKINRINKARYWTGVLYPENMLEDWESRIADTVQVPFAYCLHHLDKDSKSEHRKDHIHLILAFPNTTTYSHALGVMNLLSAEGKSAINKCQAVINIRNVYDYLIHDTEDCRKKEKELYPVDARIIGNNFDIGSYEQLDAFRKNEMFLELGELIRNVGFMNYIDFYGYVVDNFDDMNYIEVLKCYSSHFEKLTKGNYNKWVQARIEIEAPSQVRDHEKTTRKEPEFCPECGSEEIIKKGKTLAGSQRWGCKACGKRFV